MCDLRSGGLIEPRLEEHDWTGDHEQPSAMMWSPDGTGSGVSVLRSASAPERVADVADRVQEWVIEGQLWGAAPTNWPRCPHHPDSHPMQAVVEDDEAVWICPASHEVVAPVGDL